MSDRGWFEGIDLDDPAAGAARIRDGSASEPRPWSDLAVDAGHAADAAAYFERLHVAALRAFDADLETYAGAADREVIHLVRLHDAIVAADNELRQRTEEALEDHLGVDLEAAELRAALDGDRSALGERLVDLLEALDALDEERDALERGFTTTVQDVAPNLAALAGPSLAARLLAAAGSLDELAKMPSSTLQVLGAEGALFAHLRGEAPSPKHGIIFTHPAVRSAPDAERGSVARAVAGKLSIAARVDRYRGELEPSLREELDDRLGTIAERGG